MLMEFGVVVIRGTNELCFMNSWELSYEDTLIDTCPTYPKFLILNVNVAVESLVTFERVITPEELQITLEEQLV